MCVILYFTFFAYLFVFLIILTKVSSLISSSCTSQDLTCYILYVVSGILYCDAGSAISTALVIFVINPVQALPPPLREREREIFNPVHLHFCWFPVFCLTLSTALSVTLLICIPINFPPVTIHCSIIKFLLVSQSTLFMQLLLMQRLVHSL